MEVFPINCKKYSTCFFVAVFFFFFFFFFDLSNCVLQNLKRVRARFKVIGIRRIPLVLLLVRLLVVLEYIVFISFY